MHAGGEKVFYTEERRKNVRVIVDSKKGIYIFTDMSNHLCVNSNQNDNYDNIINAKPL